MIPPLLSISHAFLLQKAIMFDLLKQRVNKPRKNVLKGIPTYTMYQIEQKSSIFLNLNINENVIYMIKLIVTLT